MPAGNGEHIKRPDEGEPTIDKSDQRIYRRVIKFMMDKRQRVLSFDLREQEGSQWTLKIFSNSDWAGSKDDRRSITGYYIFLNGCLILWKSKGQKHVT